MASQVTQQQYQEVYHKVYGYFFRRLDNRTDVEDLTCTTVADYFLYSKPVQNPHALLWTIARNKLFQFIRKKTREPIVGWSDSIDPENIEITYSHTYLQCTEELIEIAKKHLKPIDFDVVELCVFCDFDSNRAAKELGITSSNVRQKLSRSLKKLRNHYQTLWPNEPFLEHFLPSK